MQRRLLEPLYLLLRWLLLLLQLLLSAVAVAIGSIAGEPGWHSHCQLHRAESGYHSQER